MIVSALCLLLGVLAYGWAGARLHEGSQDERGALRSTSWWLGTLSQAAGFLFTLVARRSLPLMLVQACADGGLGVTAAIQHVDGTRRLHRSEGLAMVTLLVGLAMLGPTTVPGPAVQIRATHLWLMATCALVCSALLAVRMPPVVQGLAAGLGFAFGAIGARLVIGDAAHPLWIFWQLPPATWGIGLLTGAGIVLGQVHMTRGLAHSTATPVLGPMYLVETVFPSVVGVWLLGELPRHGMAPLAVTGLLLALGSAIRLLRLEDPQVS